MADPRNIDLDTQLKQAELRRREAEAAKLDAEAAHALRQADLDTIYIAREGHSFDVERRDYDIRRARNGFDAGRFRLASEVNQTTVGSLREDLLAYHAVNPYDNIEIEYCSPGGNILAGFDLFDLVRRLSAAGHHVTTRVTGYAASMAGVLLQAGDKRIIGTHSYIHLHEASTLAIGKVSDLEDATEFAKRLTHHICRIYVERAGDRVKVDEDSGLPLTADTLYTWIRREERWLNSDEALDWGFVDAVE